MYVESYDFEFRSVVPDDSLPDITVMTDSVKNKQKIFPPGGSVNPRIITV